jgi:RNA polymerase sigma factor for flagellar operon FliA
LLAALRSPDTLWRDSRARLRQVQQTVQRLEHELHRPPRAKEVANELGWSLDAFHRCMVDAGAAGARTGDTELEAQDTTGWGAHEDDERHTVIDDTLDPLRALQQRQRHAALNAAFDALDEIERYVMESIYDKDMGLRDIGQVLGVSESRVSQISAEIVAKLRRRLRDW